MTTEGKDDVTETKEAPAATQAAEPTSTHPTSPNAEGVIDEATGTAYMPVVGCARCEGDHDPLVFERLTRPIPADDGSEPWSHWCPCPTTGQPILMKEVVAEVEK